MTKERIKSIDVLRVAAIFGVILIHTTTRVLEATSYALTSYQWTLFLNQFARFAVPIFFLISGYVLELNYGSGLNFKTYIKKRLAKIFVPYVFWSLVYYYFIYTTNNDNVLYAVLTGSASYQLYFIPALCIFYLLFPFFHKIYAIISKPIVLAVFTLIQIKLLYTDYFVNGFDLVDPIRISILGLYFFAVGMVAARHNERIVGLCKKWRYVAIPAAFALAYYCFSEGLSQYYKTYNIQAFYSSWRPSTLAYTFSAAVAMVALFHKLNLMRLSELSFLVFFIHVIVLEMAWKVIGHYLNPNVYFDILFFGLVTGISFALAFFLRKIPRLSKIIG